MECATGRKLTDNQKQHIRDSISPNSAVDLKVLRHETLWKFREHNPNLLGLDSTNCELPPKRRILYEKSADILYFYFNFSTDPGRTVEVPNARSEVEFYKFATDGLLLSCDASREFGGVWYLSDIHKSSPETIEILELLAGGVAKEE